MSTSQNNAKAFEIFAKYENVKMLVATNGEVYAGPNPDDVSAEDKKELSQFGWKPKTIDSTFVYAGE